MEVNVGMEWSLQFRAVKILTCNNSDSVNAALNEILACMQHNNDIHEDTDAADSDVYNYDKLSKLENEQRYQQANSRNHGKTRE